MYMYILVRGGAVAALEAAGGGGNAKRRERRRLQARHIRRPGTTQTPSRSAEVEILSFFRKMGQNFSNSSKNFLKSPKESLGMPPRRAF